MKLLYKELWKQGYRLLLNQLWLKFSGPTFSGVVFFHSEFDSVSPSVCKLIEHHVQNPVRDCVNLLLIRSMFLHKGETSW